VYQYDHDVETLNEIRGELQCVTQRGTGGSPSIRPKNEKKRRIPKNTHFKTEEQLLYKVDYYFHVHFVMELLYIVKPIQKQLRKMQL
jgi:hypothetical protein